MPLSASLFASQGTQSIKIERHITGSPLECLSNASIDSFSDFLISLQLSFKGAIKGGIYTKNTLAS